MQELISDKYEEAEFQIRNIRISTSISKSSSIHMISRIILL
jgi:hypothetical protein